MYQFKIRQDGFKEIKRAMLLKVIPIAIFAIFGGLAISYMNSNPKENDVNVFPFVIPIMLSAIGFGLFLGINRQKQIFDSFRLTLDNTTISREQHNTPSISIPISEIIEIIKNKNGSLIIKGYSSLNVIGIPFQVEDYEKLLNLLSAIHPISTIKAEPFLQKIRGVLPFLTIGLMATVYISKDKIIVSIAGAALLLLVCYAIVVVQKSKNIDHYTKKGIWWIILITISIVGIIYYKLTAIK